MASRRATNRWRVKITGLPTNVSISDLSNQFKVESQLIIIPKSQSNSSKWYALIDGFESEEQAIIFISEWNETFKRGRICIKCEIDTGAPVSNIPEDRNRK
jgi:hypothetical protein